MSIRPLLCVVFLLGCFSLPVWAQAETGEIKAKSRVVSAAVYPARATLTREAVLEVPAGASVVLLRGLPANLLTDSLRAEGKAGARVSLGAISHRRESRSELIAPREQELLSLIEEKQDRRNALEAKRSALETQRKFMERIGANAAERINEELKELRLDPAGWGEAAELLGGFVGENLQKDLRIQVDIRKLDRELQALKSELSRLHTGQRNSYAIRLPIEAESATRLTISLSYQVTGVSWRPVYDARLDTDTSKLELIQYGSVRQNTGEDWEDIRLVLSTAQPQRGAALPSLSPLWVDLFDVEAQRRAAASKARESAPRPMMLGSSPDALMAESAAPVEQEMTQQAAEIRGGFVAEYVIPGVVSVKADGTESKVLCGSFATTNRMQVHVKPQLSTDAFLVSRMELKGDTPLLPGTASLFRDGAFVGRLQLPMLRPGESRDLGFGVDDRISVKRNTIHDERSDATVLSRSNQLERHMVTEVRNQGRQRVELVLLETVPVARHDRISVEILRRHTTQDYEQDVDDVRGQLRWTIPLAAGADTRVNIGWRVSWPRDQNIFGL